MRRLVFLSLAILLTGCPATPELPDAGDSGADGDEPDGAAGLSLSSVLPRRGPVAGGTRVTVSGSGFEAGATVRFGEAAATELEVVSDGEITCASPPAEAGPGEVEVTVELPGGATATLAGGFTYEPEPPAGIDRCRLEGPAAMVVEAGATSGTVTGLVLAEGVTAGAGQGAGIRGELGFGPDGSEPSAGGWIWVGMTYGDDEGDEDRYRGSLLVSAVGEHDYAVRFTTDLGASFTYCDLDGSEAGGYSPEQAGALTVTSSVLPAVDWCRLERPAAASAQPGGESPPIFGQVFEPGVTEAEGRGSGVRAQLGLGPAGSSPAGAEWTFRDASYSGDVGNNDEYAATLTATAPGLYDYAYRFSLDGGASWVYCDTSGSEDGYSPEAAGKLTCEVPSEPEVDWCQLQWPETAVAAPGSPSPPIFGRVYEAGVTVGPGAGSPMAAELGYGPDGSEPATSADWSWVGAAFNADYGDNDEYVATLTVADEGTYDYAYRFSLDGSRWTYCDLDGSSDGYEPDRAGSLAVATAGPELADWCRLQWPPSTATAEGLPTEAIYGQVYEPGLTEAAGMGPGVLAELGFGPDGSEPATAAGWTWVPAAYNVDVGDNDEYVAVVVPTAAGSFDYAYRFSLDAGASWLYCDLDGSSDGYEPARAGELAVSAAVTVDWCALQWPHATTVAAGAASEPIYGRVFEPGVTDSAGQGAGIEAQVGYGPDGTDPSTAGWTWFAATYNVDDGTANDEYEGRVTPTAAGTYDFAYRFSLDGGLRWVHCDRTGSTDGYAPADAGELTVTD